MDRTPTLTAWFAAFALTLSAGGCALVFSPEIFQNLRLVFRLTEGIEQNSEMALQSLFFPGPVVTKGKFVRVSGQLQAPEGGELPNQVILEAETVDADSGAFKHRFKLTLQIDEEGKFSGSKKFKKNFKADQLMTVTAKPKGADLAVDTQVTLCVDIVQKKADLDSLDDCVDDGGNGGAPTTLTAIQNEIFTPSCAVAGCHDNGTNSAGLVLETGRSFGELVNVPSNQQPFLQRVAPGLPDSSYLVDKLTGASNIAGVRMPVGGPFLSDEQVAGIVQWIEEGAENN